MSVIRSRPCSNCPYRLDCPSGVWDATEYAKLPPYDRPTAQQPLNAFACHATPDFLCAGWAQVHTSRGHEFDLIALRIARVEVIPEITTPLFASGREAAEHGLAEVNRPGPAAGAAIEKLTRIHARRRSG